MYLFPGIHRGGHSSLPRGEARGEHADQRLREPDLQIFRGFIRLKYFCPQGEEGVNLALDRWELLKLYSSCKRNHKPCHDWSQRKNENSNYFLGKMRFPSTDIRSFLFSPHKITSLSIINFCFVLWLLKLWLPESQMKSLVFSQGIFSFGFFPCSMRMCWRRILKDYNPKKISRSLQYIVSFYFS